MLSENPSTDLDEQLAARRFKSTDAMMDYLSKLKIELWQFSISPEGHLLFADGDPLSEKDPDTGEIRFSQAGINATAEWMENLNWIPDCF